MAYSKHDAISSESASHIRARTARRCQRAARAQLALNGWGVPITGTMNACERPDKVVWNRGDPQSVNAIRQRRYRERQS